MVKYSNVTVQLIGEDGNAFAIIGNVSQAIRREIGAAEAKAFADEAFEQSSYTDLLILCQKTVHVL